MSPTPRELRADCARCCGLCCTALAFDATQGFGYDKPAGRPCHYLDTEDRCAIHADRPAHGFVACEGYECFGAGQWVTQRLFGGRSWRTHRPDAPAMFNAFARFRVLHELLAAVELVRSRAQRDEGSLAALRERVEAACAVEEAYPGRVAIPALRRSILRALRATATATP